jgi:tRNA(His) 5'-end guanylyltransferase
MRCFLTGKKTKKNRFSFIYLSLILYSSYTHTILILYSSFAAHSFKILGQHLGGFDKKKTLFFDENCAILGRKGRREKWKIGRVEEWRNGRMENWKIGRVEY